METLFILLGLSKPKPPTYEDYLFAKAMCWWIEVVGVALFVGLAVSMLHAYYILFGDRTATWYRAVAIANKAPSRWVMVCTLWALTKLAGGKVRNAGILKGGG